MHMSTCETTCMSTCLLAAMQRKWGCTCGGRLRHTPPHTETHGRFRIHLHRGCEEWVNTQDGHVYECLFWSVYMYVSHEHVLACVCHRTCILVYVCPDVHSSECHWAYMCVCSAFMGMSLLWLNLCAYVSLHVGARVCVRARCWHVWYRVSVSACVCVLLCPSAPLWCCHLRQLQGQPGTAPRAPLTAVFYHHLPRKGAQEDGDK